MKAPRLLRLDQAIVGAEAETEVAVAVTVDAVAEIGTEAAEVAETAVVGEADVAAMVDATAALAQTEKRRLPSLAVTAPMMTSTPGSGRAVRF